MGSISLSRKRACYTASWKSWGTISGSDAIRANNAQIGNSHCVYSANVSLGASEQIKSLSLKTTIAMTSQTGTVNSKAVTIDCYVYSSDPTGGTAGTDGTIPGGYLYWTQLNITAYTAGTNITIPFPTTSISGVSTLYFWITSTYSVRDGCYIEVYHGNGPSVSATYTAPSITLSVSPATVTTSADSDAGKVNLTIGNPSGQTLIASFYYGSSTTPLAQYYVYNGTNQIKCPKSWFDDAGVTRLTSMTIRVKITGATNEPEDTFTLAAGDDMKPTIGTPSTEIVQAAGGATTYYPNTYIAGLSKCKVSVAVTLPTNAGVATNGAYLAYPGGSRVNMQYNSTTGKYEGTTAALTGNTTITITVMDERGKYSQKTVTISGVVAYTEPSVEINLAYRCNSEGTQESGGQYWRIRVTAQYSTALSGNSLRKLTAGIENGVAYSLISGSTSSPFSGMTNPKTNYKVIVTVQDKVSGEITKEIVLEGLLRNFVWTRSTDGTYVGVGTTPTRTSGGSSIEVPQNGAFLIGGTEYGAFNDNVDGDVIPQSIGGGNTSFGNDFLNVDRTNRYALTNAASTFSSWGGGCDNTPSPLASSVFGGLRTVFILSAAVAVVVLLEVTPQAGRVWVNTYINDAWQGWKYFVSYSAS